MRKKILLIFIILLGVALIGALFLSLFPKYIPESITRINPLVTKEPEPDNSAFGHYCGVNESTETGNCIPATPTPEPTKVEYKRATDSDVVAKKFLAESMALNERERQGLPPLPWQWDTVKFFAQVDTKDTQNEKLGIHFIYPSDSPFSKKVTQVSLNCPPEVTAKFNRNDYGFLGSGIDIYKEAQEWDYLSAFCLNEACTEVGKECILIKW